MMFAPMGFGFPAAIGARFVRWNHSRFQGSQRVWLEPLARVRLFAVAACHEEGRR